MSESRASSSDRYITSQSGDAWATDAAEQGKIGTQQLISVETVPATAEVRLALGLPDGADVVVRRRLILADAQPVEIAESYYPAAIAAGTPLAENSKIRGGAVRVLAEAGYQLDESIERITAEHPSESEAALLEVDPTEPLIVMRRLSTTDDRGPVEYAINRMVSSRVQPPEYRMRNTAK